MVCSSSEPAIESTDSLPRQIQGTLSGSWFDRSLNGQGFVFELGLNPDSAVATGYWFTHRDGKPYWLFGIAPYEGDEPLLDFALLDVSGTGFGKDFDAEDINITTWGRAAFGFTGCTEGFAIWTDQANTSGLFDLERITLGLDGADCPAATQRLTWFSFKRPLEARSTVSVTVLDDVVDTSATQFSFSLRGGATNRLAARRSFFDRNIEIGVSGLFFKELADLILPRLATTAMSHDVADHAAPASTPVVATSQGRTHSESTLATPLSTAPFFLAANGITVLCPAASAGDTGVIDGVTYTKRARDQITTDNAATTCTSGITDMSGLCREKATFNQPIDDWSTGSVVYMTGMFLDARAFNQDLSGWCVSAITTQPSEFDVLATSWRLDRPQWGAACKDL